MCVLPKTSIHLGILFFPIRRPQTSIELKACFMFSGVQLEFGLFKLKTNMPFCVWILVRKLS